MSWWQFWRKRKEIPPRLEQIIIDDIESFGAIGNELRIRVVDEKGITRYDDVHTINEGDSLTIDFIP